MSIVERIQHLMYKTNTTTAMLTEKLSLTKKTITQWEHGKQSPSLDAIIKLSKYFNVTTDYLIFGNQSGSLPYDQQMMIDLYNQLDDTSKVVIFHYLQSKVDSLNNTSFHEE